MITKIAVGQGKHNINTKGVSGQHDDSNEQ